MHLDLDAAVPLENVDGPEYRSVVSPRPDDPQMSKFSDYASSASSVASRSRRGVVPLDADFSTPETAPINRKPRRGQRSSRRSSSSRRPTRPSNSRTRKRSLRRRAGGASAFDSEMAGVQASLGRLGKDMEDMKGHLRTLRADMEEATAPSLGGARQIYEEAPPTPQFAATTTSDFVIPSNRIRPAPDRQGRGPRTARSATQKSQAPSRGRLRPSRSRRASRGTLASVSPRTDSSRYKAKIRRALIASRERLLAAGIDINHGGRARRPSSSRSIRERFDVSAARTRPTHEAEITLSPAVRSTPRPSSAIRQRRKPSTGLPNIMPKPGETLTFGLSPSSTVSLHRGQDGRVQVTANMSLAL